MTLKWEGEETDHQAAVEASRVRETFLENAYGDPLVIGNEFSEIRVFRVETRNGARIMIDSPKSGQWVTLDPLELESLTWQTPETFSAMVGNPYGPLFWEDE